MRGSIPYVFRNFEKTLREIDNWAVEVPSVNEVIDNFVLIFLADKVIEDDKSLRFIPLESFMKRNEEMKRNDVESLDNFISHFWIDSCCKVIQKKLILVLMKILCKEKNFIEMKEIVNHVKKGVRFATSAWSRNDQPERIFPHRGMNPLMVCSSSWLIKINCYLIKCRRTKMGRTCPTKTSCWNTKTKHSKRFQRKKNKRWNERIGSWKTLLANYEKTDWENTRRSRRLGITATSRLYLG